MTHMPPVDAFPSLKRFLSFNCQYHSGYLAESTLEKTGNGKSLQTLVGLEFSEPIYLPSLHLPACTLLYYALIHHTLRTIKD